MNASDLMRILEKLDPDTLILFAAGDTVHTPCPFECGMISFEPLAYVDVEEGYVGVENIPTTGYCLFPHDFSKPPHG